MPGSPPLAELRVSAGRAAPATGAAALPRGVKTLPATALKADHARGLFEQSVASLGGNLIGLGLLALMFAPLAPRPQMIGWTACAVLLWLVRLAHQLRYLRAKDSDDATLIRWGRSWQCLMLVQGVVWGSGVWIFYGLGSDFHLIALVVIVYSYCLGAMQVLASFPATFRLFTGLVLMSTVARVATDTGRDFHLQLAALLTVLFAVTLMLGRAYRGAYETAIELKVRTERLAAQLRIEKAAAEDAYRAAEAASRAKTQFFAAASHDLRQPLHAMGLFAEALRQRNHDPEVASLVNSINDSVDALEGLFGELLDITRIDTGGVEVDRQPMRMRELFTRLKLHFEPIAFEKGLLLKFRGDRHVAHSDPLLVERILRNLVSNALRYTEDGGVLVACRARGGRLLLQVFDSGIGISEHNLPRIFDEFYQVQGERPLQAHHRKGLGLGLSIVKRLADLIEAPLEVRSIPGRGTCFSLWLPVGAALRQTPPQPFGNKAALGLTLQTRNILVVEDEAAVREGLEVLLKAWGAQVQSFESHAAVAAWLPSAGAARPDLIIADYRLPDARTGVEVIALVRRQFGLDIPAVVVTGSMMSGHEAEADAQTHDFHMLLKPVVPNKLRAMIAFKLGMR